jgi:hypothetical protein
MRWAKITIAAIMLMGLSSCKTLEQKIIGQWISEDQNQAVEFAADGTAIFTTYGFSVTADYKFTDKAHAKFVFRSPLGELEGTQIAFVGLENDELSLEFESGLTRGYQRVKS